MNRQSPLPTCDLCGDTINPIGAAAKIWIRERGYSSFTAKFDRRHKWIVHPTCLNKLSDSMRASAAK